MTFAVGQALTTRVAGTVDDENRSIEGLPAGHGFAGESDKLTRPSAAGLRRATKMRRTTAPTASVGS